MRFVAAVLLVSMAAWGQGVPPVPRNVEVTGNVQAFPPDGGIEVRGTVDVRAPLGIIVEGQSGPIEVYGVSGARVGVEGPVTATISGTLPGFAAVPTVALENGTLVSLTPASLATLTATTGKGNCTYVDGDPTATIGTTPANIPSVPMANRTAIEIFNHSTAPANYLLCSAQGTATTTSGVRIESGHASRKWEGLGAGVIISCRCVTGTCTYGYQEEWCYQQ